MRADVVQRWLETELGADTLPDNRRIVELGIIRDVLMMAAFGAFAAIAQCWLIDERPAPRWLFLTLLSLLVANWLLHGLSIRLTAQLRRQWRSLLEQRLASQLIAQQQALVRRHPVYYWQTLWQKHVPALADWRCDYCLQQRLAVWVPVFALGLIFYLNYFIGLMLVLTLPVVPLFMIIVGKGAAYLHQRELVALNRLGSLFTDRLQALPLLAATRAHAHQQQQLEKASSALNQRTMKVVSVAFLSNTVLDFFATLTVALIAVFIGFSLLEEVSVGPPVTLFSGLWILLCAPLVLSQMKKMGAFYHQKAQAESAREALSGLLVKPEQAETPTTADNHRISDFVLHTPHLRAERLAVHPNCWIQISGPSGCGKTALLEALAGQRRASHRLRGSLVMLSQQPVTLPLTIRANLCLGQDYSDQALWQALEQVELASRVRALNGALDYRLGEFAQLSGGELQRLAIARLLLRQADIWLLDEPTAHLPEQQHIAISQLLHRVCHNKTVLWVSHKTLPARWFNQQWSIADGTVYTTTC
ncbi:ATP-binding cassette domain-containing protein [Salinimonas lutimaris]|uniref:ATP-binding cassette domain-containing protein n=1 Tax=Salinimonas lutimaris TaxID=914153 RepID=UPI00158622C0|nr:ATP-binding cassette domain-containing protein [Salinimonas lutimaris]